MPEKLTFDDVRSQVSYDPSTGIFTRTNSPRRKGMTTGSLSSDGKYVTVYLNGKSRLAHRLAWLYVFGELPRGEIDHINGDGRDNSLGNLRDVDRRTNQQNLKKPITGKTLPLGVYLSKRKKTNCFSASIRIGGKSVHLGWFNSSEEAGAAYVEAKRKHHAGCTI